MGRSGTDLGYFAQPGNLGGGHRVYPTGERRSTAR